MLEISWRGRTARAAASTLEETLIGLDRLRLRTSLKSSATRAAFIWLLLAASVAPVSLAQKLDDGNGAFRTGMYRDLFAEQGHAPAATKARIEKAFQQLFHGDALSERVYDQLLRRDALPHEHDAL